MKHDLLLMFLSEKGAGSWAELKEAWTWLTGDSHDPADAAWIVARDLAALGHLEVSWDEETTWAAAPPLISMLPRSGGRALVTGARTRHLYAPTEGATAGEGYLTQAAAELDIWIDPVPNDNGPTALYAACSSHTDAEGLAHALEVPYTYEIAETLAGLLPPLSALDRLWPAGNLPRGFDTERFDPAELAWVPVPEPAGHALYRCRTYQGHVHALNGPAGWRRVVREPAVYEVLRWEERRVLLYDYERHELRVPGHAGLPTLHARAAVLCSGRLPARRFPRRGQFELIYANVPPDIADRIASSLCQELADPE